MLWLRSGLFDCVDQGLCFDLDALQWFQVRLELT